MVPTEVGTDQRTELVDMYSKDKALFVVFEEASSILTPCLSPLSPLWFKALVRKPRYGRKDTRVAISTETERSIAQRISVLQLVEDLNKINFTYPSR